MKENGKFTDSLFHLYFSEDPKRAIGLLNALDGTDYPGDSKLQYIPLERAPFMDGVNNLSFVIDGRLIVFAELPSTMNHNMALWMLLYLRRVYEFLLTPEATYRSKRIDLPVPKFFVLYDGAEEALAHEVQQLSDAFMQKDGPAPFDLTVDVFNINYSRDNEVLKRSKSLEEYALFIDCVRKHKQVMGFSDAIKTAIGECVDRGIMKEFWQKHGGNVESWMQQLPPDHKEQQKL